MLNKKLLVGKEDKSMIMIAGYHNNNNKLWVKKWIGYHSFIDDKYVNRIPYWDDKANTFNELCDFYMKGKSSGSVSYKAYFKVNNKSNIVAYVKRESGNVLVYPSGESSISNLRLHQGERCVVTFKPEPTGFL